MTETPPPLAASLAPAFDLLLDVVCMVDAQGQFVHVSAAARQVFGYAPEELVGRRMIDLVLPEDRERTLQAAQRVMAGQTHLNFENRYLRKDGQVVHLLWSARWLPEAGLRVAVARDISERKRAEQVQAATYAISEAVHRVQDLGMLCQEVHQNIATLMPGHNLAVALHDDEGRALSFPYWADRRGPVSAERRANLAAFCHQVIQRGEVHMVRRGVDPEAEAWVDPELQCRVGVPLSTPNGVIGALVLKSYGDETGCSEQDLALLQYICTQLATAIERLQLYGRLRHLSHHDALTGLPNRALLRDRLSLAMARARRGESFLSVLYLDLDRFKEVNDTHGHLVGDHLLQAFADRLKTQLRASDTVARVGGDEFVVLLESPRGLEGNRAAAEKIRQAFAAPFEVDGRVLAIQPSLGLADFPADGEEEGQLLSAADQAMYTAKGARP
ncbi:diguanylate cyclase domain-containing protein [Ideonella dechloratans]|uniref:diguanylate cyclase domain-containing protein n=1 Tax=Ideonella dechloratans TaxID=36863 RepID=UPI0035B43D4B